ncbi:hypothetical protein D3C85_1723110 [compost metagenome]
MPTFQVSVLVVAENIALPPDFCVTRNVMSLSKKKGALTKIAEAPLRPVLETVIVPVKVMG